MITSTCKWDSFIWSDCSVTRLRVHFKFIKSIPWSRSTVQNEREYCAHIARLTVLLWLGLSGEERTSNGYVISSEYDENADKLRAIGVFFSCAVGKCASYYHRWLCLDSNCSAFRHHWRSSISLWFFVMCDVWNGAIIAYVECILSLCSLLFTVHIHI